MKRKIIGMFLVIALVGSILPASAMAASLPTPSSRTIGYARGIKPISYVRSWVDYKIVAGHAIYESIGDQTNMGAVSNSGIRRVTNTIAVHEWRAKNTFSMGVPTGSGTFGWAMSIIDRFVINKSGINYVYPNYK